MPQVITISNKCLSLGLRVIRSYDELYLSIVPRIGVIGCGVSNYATLLAKSLESHHGLRTSFMSLEIGLDAGIGECSKQRIGHRKEALALALEGQMQVLLHYVGYGFEKRGCPLWLLRGLRAWKQRHSSAMLITMFHELYATGLPWQSSFWTSPHQRVKIGNACSFERTISFKYDGIYGEGVAIEVGNHVFIGRDCEFNIKNRIEIGNNSLIASGCRFIDHDHGMALGTPMSTQQGEEVAIKIGSDVWLGVNVVVLKGVVIGDGAVVGAGAIVTKSIPPNEIWAGIPAKKIRTRV